MASFSSFEKVLGRLDEFLAFLKGTKIKGQLSEANDPAKMTDFKHVSLRSAGRKFVIKGLDSNGRSVKLSADWGQLSDGQIYFKPDKATPFQDARETEIDLDVASKKLVLEFEAASGDDYQAVFSVQA